MKTLKSAVKWGAMMAIMGSTQVHAATLVQSLNNTVANGTIDGSDLTNSNWSSVVGFQTDPNEGSTVDWHQISIANDTSNFYLRYQMNASPTLDFNLRMFFDTDLSRSTGYIGGDAQFSVGAEYMLEGASLYRFTSSDQIIWGWEWVGTLAYDASYPQDYSLGVSISTLGTNTFNFLVFSEGSIDGSGYRDYYLDSANLGNAGGYLQYTTVPEPGTVALFGLGAGVLLLYRRRRA
jgi:PEP-CTERM motif